MRVSSLSVLSFLIFINTAANATTPCNLNGQGEITETVSDRPARGWCLITPQAMQIKIHYLGLCKNQPSWQNFDSQCEQLFSSDVGQLVTVSKDDPFDLNSQISISEGTYQYAAVFIDRNINHASKVKFDTDRGGYSSDGNGSIGKWCWSLSGSASASRSQDDYREYLAECGSSEPETIGYHTSSPNYIHNNANGQPGDYSTGTTESTTWEVFLLDENRQRDGDPSPASGGVDDAKYLIGLQRFASAVEITANTSGVDLGFRLTNTFGVLMADNVNDPGRDTVKQFVLGGFEFKVETD